MYFGAVGFQRSAASRDVPVDYDEHAVTVSPPKHEAAGMRAVMVSLQRELEQMGALRTAAALARLNQRKGFDCPGCAWPEEQGGRKLAEFCENGAKAVAEEATKRTVTPEFFARHSIAELSAKPEYWLSQQGRLAHPMVLRPGDDHYRPISWDAAYRLIAEQLNAWTAPDQAVFYTSGRTSNEAAFLLPAAGPQLRHQQPARLLQHVPRVLGLGADRVDRHRQGVGHRRGRRACRPDRHRRTEPGHQPSRGCCRCWRRQRPTAPRSLRSTRCPRPG